VSAALAAVVDRATDKDLDRRYLDASEMAADLEDALAIETARSGHATGEATTVLRTLPADTRRRVPLRLRVPAWLLALLALGVVAGAVVAIVVAKDNAERGTKPAGVSAPPGLSIVQLKTQAAEDFDPFGGDGEHPEEASAAIDDDPRSSWSTESYQGGVLNKPGVGLYLDASPGVVAKKLELRTSTPGWSGAVYAAKSGPPESLDGWQRVADLNDVQRRQQVDLDTAGQRFRYYLVWITKLPEGQTKASISDLALLGEQ